MFHRLMVGFSNVCAVITDMLEVSDFLQDQQFGTDICFPLGKPILDHLTEAVAIAIDLFLKLIGFLHLSLGKGSVHAVAHIIQEFLDEGLIIPQILVGGTIKNPFLVVPSLAEQGKVEATVGY